MIIACLLSDDFEDAELRIPYDRFRQAGHEVYVVGVERGKMLVGKKGLEKVRVEKAIDDVRADEFDALFIPGGYSPDRLRGDERFVRFTKEFAGKPILTVCHGPQLLLTAGMVKGRTMTAWKTVQKDLELGGAKVLDREVVIDANLLTSRSPSDLEAFVRESLVLLDRWRRPVT